MNYLKHGTWVCLLLAAGAVLADPPAIPEKWEGAAPGAPEAAEVADRCGVKEADLRRMIADAGSEGMVIRRPADTRKPYLVVNSRRVVCVQVSPRGYPLLPQEVFDKTIDFEGMMTDTLKELRAAIAQQLAARGVATALIKNEKGNAVQVTYMFTQEQPTRVYYQTSFWKAGEFDERRYDFVFSSPGGYGLTARGNRPGENYKSLFAE